MHLVSCAQFLYLTPLFLSPNCFAASSSPASVFVIITIKNTHYTKMKFSIKDFFSKCDQIRSFCRIWPHLLEKILYGRFHFFQ